MATHSSILAWRIPWTEEPGGPQSVGSQRVGHLGKQVSPSAAAPQACEAPMGAPGHTWGVQQEARAWPSQVWGAAHPLL